MQINPDEITASSKQSASRDSDSGAAELTEVGTVLSVMPNGIARLHGLENWHCPSRCSSFRTAVTGLALNLESEQRRRGAVRRVGSASPRATPSSATGPSAWRSPVGRADARTHRRPARASSWTQRARSVVEQTRPAEFKAPGVVQRPRQAAACRPA